MASWRDLGDRCGMRRTREIWVRVIQQFQKSGLTQEEYARQQEIPVGTLRSWIYTLRRAADEGAPLLPVRVIASTPPAAGSPEAVATVIEVELGDPVRLRFSTATATAVIAELVLRLRPPC